MPEQHDPIDELARFGAGLGSATPGGDMPLSPADVRRRGDQIRRRRTALVAGGAALAVAAVAVPVFAVIGNDGPRSEKDQVAQDVPPLTRADLLRDADTEYDPEGYSLFHTTDTFEGDGQAVYLPCQREKTSALGATDSFTRTFDLAANPDKLEPGDTLPDDRTDDDLTELVAQFETPDAARAAYDQFAEWILDCEIPGADDVSVTPQGRSVDVPEGDAVVFDLQWGPVPEELDPYRDMGYISETGLILQDDRIAVVSVKIIGMDYNWQPENGGSPLDRMLPKAAERLLPADPTVEPTDPAVPTDPTEPVETETTDGGDPGAAPIPDAFPLMEGWPEEAGDGKGRIGPARDLEQLALEACDTRADDPAHADRLLARFDNAEDYRTRQLTTYASADEAVAAVAAIREVYAACPTGEVRDDGYTPHWAVVDTQLGGDSFAVLGWDTFDGGLTPAGETLLVVRLGSAVLVVVNGGESGAPAGGQDQRAVDRIVQESAPVVDRMCTWTAQGC
jgi:hypothetical protein